MKSITTLALLLIAASAFGQAPATAAKSFWADPFNDPMLPVYTVTFLVFIVAVLVAVVAIYLIRVLNMFSQQDERERAARAGVAYVPKPSWFDRFAQQMNASVPVTKEKEIELDHSYDGIRELDNHLPPWWKWLFYATIGWSVVYIIVYHVADNLPLQITEYENEVALAEEQARAFRASQPQAEIDVAALVYKAETEIIEKGKSVFLNNNCGSCHRNDGGGNAIGPNLTDPFWLHGGDIKDIFKTIKDGVVEKGMPAWGKAMSPQDVRNVAFFVMSMQGTNPANAKAPQGEMAKPILSDSTQAAL